MVKKATVAKKIATAEKLRNPGKSLPSQKTTIDSINDFLTRRMNILGYFFTGLTLLFSFLLFDSKVSLSGDDSFYIMRAMDLIKKFEFPSFQGPLYPIVLGLFILIGGFNLTLLKMLSLFAMAGAVFILHKALSGRIPPLLHITVLLVTSVNAFLLHFASQTYSEAFYMLIQSTLAWYFLTRFIDHSGQENLKHDLLKHLYLAGLLVAIMLTRSIGLTAFLAVTGYFLLYGQWRNLLFSITCFALIVIVYLGIKWLFWGDTGGQFTSQGAGLLQKDFYNPALGQEDLAGFLARWMKNSNLYISRHFFTISGFREYTLIQGMLPLLTWLFYALFLTGLVFSYLKNRSIFFLGLITGIFMTTSFFILQTNWDQARLIIPVYPFMLLMFLSPVIFISGLKKAGISIWLLPIVGIFMFGQVFAYSVTTAKEVRKNSGPYEGLTPDWKHYGMISEWAAKNLPDTAVIACRKPSISFIYGKGREFYGIMSVPNFDATHFFTHWVRDSVPYYIYNHDELSKTALPIPLVIKIRSCVVARFLIGNSSFLAYNFPDSIRDTILEQFARKNLTAITRPESFRAIAFNGNQPPLISYPDSLLIPLMRDGVTHVITARLRKQPDIKSEQFINTVERYMTTVADKYPDIMQLVHQIGNDDDEPAAVYRLNYEKQRWMVRENEK